MAASLIAHLLSPRTVPAVATFPSTPRVIRRGSLVHFAALGSVLRAIGEGLLLLWMLAPVVLFALIGAGASGLLQ